MNDNYFMEEAIREAKRAKSEGDLPFGAVVVKDGKIIARGRSREQTKQDVAEHAEMNAIRQVTKKPGLDLSGCTIYATSEPCIMCSWAILKTKISRVVIGTMRNDHPGFFRKRKIRFENLVDDSEYKPEIKIGLMEKEIIELFKDIRI